MHLCGLIVVFVTIHFTIQIMCLLQTQPKKNYHRFKHINNHDDKYKKLQKNVGIQVVRDEEKNISLLLTSKEQRKSQQFTRIKRSVEGEVYEDYTGFTFYNVGVLMASRLGK